MKTDAFSRRPDIHSDRRGSVYELVRACDLGERRQFGQVFVTTALPGQSKGKHYHQRKIEWFVAVAGRGEMILTEVSTGERAVIVMDSAEPLVVKTVPGIAHELRNTGDVPLVALVYTDTPYDRDDPDTFEHAGGRN